MREAAHPEPICAICNQPITQKQWPYRTLASGEKAHLACALDHLENEEKKPVP